jgi:hypothetical protein
MIIHGAGPSGICSEGTAERKWRALFFGELQRAGRWYGRARDEMGWEGGAADGEIGVSCLMKRELGLRSEV